MVGCMQDRAGRCRQQGSHVAKPEKASNAHSMAIYAGLATGAAWVTSTMRPLDLEGEVSIYRSCKARKLSSCTNHQWSELVRDVR